jgi:hypothetical protein
MKKSLVLCAITAPLLCTYSYAFFCPTNFSQINYGDTIAQVEQTCGKADKTVTKDAPEKVPQEWDYFLNQAAPTNTLAPAQGTSKTALTFDASGKLVNITVNNVGIGSINTCGAPVSIGDSMESVEAACGKPGFVNKQQTTQPAPGSPASEENKEVAMTYNSTPPVTLVFIGGKLTEKK